MIIDILEAILLGMLAAVSIIYTFQTRIAYPDWMLQTFEHPWAFICLFIVAILFVPASPRIAVRLILLMVALWMDWILFARSANLSSSAFPGPSSSLNSPSTQRKVVAELWPYDPPSAARYTDTAGTPPQEVAMEEPNYPVFHDIDDYMYGPAPF